MRNSSRNAKGMNPVAEDGSGETGLESAETIDNAPARLAASLGLTFHDLDLLRLALPTALFSMTGLLQYPTRHCRRSVASRMSALSFSGMPFSAMSSPITCAAVIPTLPRSIDRETGFACSSGAACHLGTGNSTRGLPLFGTGGTGDRRCARSNAGGAFEASLGR